MEGMRIGIIADTHGALHPRLPEVFAGVDAIVHAGDIGGRHVIEALERLAPVTAVLGNNDDASGTDILRAELGGLCLLLTHILPRPHAVRSAITASLLRRKADLVIFGHSHLPHDEEVAGVRFFNPASAGPRRFDYPTAVGIAEIAGRDWTIEHVPLDERSTAALIRRMNQLSR
jgi:putative phosphoesterase